MAKLKQNHVLSPPNTVYFTNIYWHFLFLPLQPFPHLSLTVAQVDTIRVAISSLPLLLFFLCLILWGKQTNKKTSNNTRPHCFGAWVLQFSYRTDFLAGKFARMDLELSLVVLLCFALAEGSTGYSCTTHPGFSTAPESAGSGSVASSTHRLWGWETADSIFF